MRITCGVGRRVGFISFTLSQIINSRVGKIQRNKMFHHRHHHYVFSSVSRVCGDSW